MAYLKYAINNNKIRKIEPVPSNILGGLIKLIYSNQKDKIQISP